MSKLNPKTLNKVKEVKISKEHQRNVDTAFNILYQTFQQSGCDLMIIKSKHNLSEDKQYLLQFTKIPS